MGKVTTRQRKRKTSYKLPYQDFPLSPHVLTNRWYKTIRGRRYHFGRLDDWQGALGRFQEVRDDLMAGRTPAAWRMGAGLTLRDTCNDWLRSRREDVETGALAHRTAAELNISFAWLRLFSAYGPYDNPGWLIPSLILKMMQGERPQCTEGTQLWDYLYIKDAALAALAVMETPRATGFFNLASGAPVRIKDIVVKLRDMIAPGMDLQFGEVPFRTDQIMHMEGDPSRLTASTGWTPATTLDQGLEETWAWFRDHAQEYD